MWSLFDIHRSGRIAPFKLAIYQWMKGKFLPWVLWAAKIVGLMNLYAMKNAVRPSYFAIKKDFESSTTYFPFLCLIFLVEWKCLTQGVIYLTGISQGT